HATVAQFGRLTGFHVRLCQQKSASLQFALGRARGNGWLSQRHPSVDRRGYGAKHIPQQSADAGQSSDAASDGSGSIDRGAWRWLGSIAVANSRASNEEAFILRRRWIIRLGQNRRPHKTIVSYAARPRPRPLLRYRDEPDSAGSGYASLRLPRRQASRRARSAQAIRARRGRGLWFPKGLRESLSSTAVPGPIRPWADLASRAAD